MTVALSRGRGGFAASGRGGGGGDGWPGRRRWWRRRGGGQGGEGLAGHGESRRCCGAAGRRCLTTVGRDRQGAAKTEESAVQQTSRRPRPFPTLAPLPAGIRRRRSMRLRNNATQRGTESTLPQKGSAGLRSSRSMPDERKKRLPRKRGSSQNHIKTFPHGRRISTGKEEGRRRRR